MAATTRVGSLKRYFKCLKDPRVRGRTEHRLIDIIAIALMRSHCQLRWLERYH